VPEDTVRFADLTDDRVPRELQAAYYFDFDAHPFEHAALFDRYSRSLIDAIGGIDDYLRSILPPAVEAARPVGTRTQDDFPGRSVGRFTVLLEEGAVFEPAFVVGADEAEHPLVLRRGARVLGANLWLDDGGVVVGEGSVVEPGTGIKGPTVIGRESEVRQGAYIRGDVLVGDRCTLRGEIKNTVMMNDCDFPHPSYLGDSLCGYHTHFGNQTTSANLRVFDLLDHKKVRVDLHGVTYDLGRRKVGIVLGDYTQVGCNCVSDPGCFLAPWVLCYQLGRLNKGFYGPNLIIKNKPLEHETIEHARLRKDV
jgi:hypothetical protein